MQEKLIVPYNTVKTHVGHSYMKLEICTRGEQQAKDISGQIIRLTL